MKSPEFIKLALLTMVSITSFTGSIRSSHADDFTTIVDGQSYSCTSTVVAQPNPPARPVPITPGLPGQPIFPGGRGPGFNRVPVTCIQRCDARADRFTNLTPGDCLSFGQDFCGQNPSCYQNCTSRADRFTNLTPGECLTYGADICSSN